MSLKAFLLRMFGLGKQDSSPGNQPDANRRAPRTHPYDEVSDEQLENNRRAPRSHPYDEVSDEQLEDNRRKQRTHPYDEISDEQLQENRRVQRSHPYDEVSDTDLEERRREYQSNPGKSKKGAAKMSYTPEKELNYVEVDVQPTKTDASKLERVDRVLYSEVQVRQAN